MKTSALLLRRVRQWAALGAVLACALTALAQKTPTAGRQNAPRSSSVPSSWKSIPVPVLPPFRPQEPKRIELANGMVIFLQEDHELPLIDGVARIRGGARDVPGDHAGMMSIYGQAWRNGGSTSRTGDELDEFLESRAAQVATNGSIDSTSISFSSLKGDFDAVFPVFADLLRNPAFRQEKIDLAKQQITSAISRRNDDVDDIVEREGAKIGYGADNPYARVPEYYTVAAVSRQDLLDFHAKYVQPNNIILGITGDFDTAAMEATLAKAFGDWPRGPQIQEPALQFHAPKPGIYFAQKADVNQSNVELITLGIERRDPDFYATRVMNEILGGGFSSRLFNDIRSVRGLAYSVGGGLGASYDHPGLFQVGLGTKSSTTMKALEALREDLDGMVTRPATEEELKRAKDSILNSFIFNFDSKQKVMAERMRYEFYGYPPDFLERYRAAIEKVTAADVERVARKYVHSGQMAVLVVGNDAEFDQKLSTLGPVTTLDLTIPEAPPGAKPAAAASNPEGRALIVKVAQAIGSPSALEAVKAEQQKARQSLHTSQGDLEIATEALLVFPDRMRVVAHTPDGDQAFTVGPDAAFVSMGPQSMDLPSAQKQEYLNGVHRDIVFLAQHAADPGCVFSAAGTEKIGEVEAAVLDVQAAGTALRLYVDPASGRVLRSSYRVTGRMGPTDEVADFSDWKPVDGLTLPFTRSISQNGQVTRTVAIESITLNPAVDPKLFAKPAPAESAPAQK